MQQNADLDCGMTANYLAVDAEIVKVCLKHDQWSQ